MSIAARRGLFTSITAPTRHGAQPRRSYHIISLPTTRPVFQSKLKYYHRWQTTFASSAPAAGPAPRSRLSRFVRTFLLVSGTGFVFTVFGLLLGVRMLPNRDALSALLEAQRNPTPDSATLKPDAYEPPSPETANLNRVLLSSPLATALRAAPPGTYAEARPHLKIPPTLRPANLTGGTLAGPGRISVPPLVFTAKDGSRSVALFHLGQHLCGHQGIVHGGLLATLLDEGLARACFPALPSKIGVTANLNINYRKPAKADMFYVLKAETLKVEGRKAWVRGWIEEMPLGGAGSDEHGEDDTATTVMDKDPKKVVVEAEALFIEPRNAKFLKKVYGTSADEEK